MNTDILENISIEQFAAFLDGNLKEEDMQSVAATIDVNKELSDILSEVMLVDESVDLYANHLDMLQSEMPDMDFDLPVIPILAESTETVELSVVSTDNSTIEFMQTEGMHLSIASDTADPIASSQDIDKHIQASDYENMAYDQSDEEFFIDE